MQSAERSNTVRLVRQKLSCCRCSCATNDPFYLSECSHLYCAECVKSARQTRACLICGSTVGDKAISHNPLLSTIAQAFWELNSCWEQKISQPNKFDRERSPPRFDETCIRSLSPQNAQSTTEQLVTENLTRKIPEAASQSSDSVSEPVSRVKIFARSTPKLNKEIELDEENTFLADCSQFISMSPHSPKITTQPSLLKNSLQISQENHLTTTLDTLTQCNSCEKLRSEIDRSKRALNALLSPSPSLRTMPSISINSRSVSENQFSAVPPPSSLSSLETMPPAAHNSTLSLLSQQEAFQSVQKQMENSKAILQGILAAPVAAEEISGQSTTVEDPVPFLWNHQALPVIATYSSISNLLLFEDARKRGWIDSSSQPISSEQECKMLITEIAVEEHDNLRLVRRTMTYMKCLLLGYQIVDFSWIRDSLDRGDVVDPKNYEVHGTTQDTIFYAPQRIFTIPRDKENRPKLFEGLEFTVLEDSLSTKFKTVDVEALVILAGGIIRNGQNMNEGGLPSIHIMLSLHLKRKGKPVREDIATTEPIVSVSWLFDSICDLQRRDIDDYILGRL